MNNSFYFGLKKFRVGVMSIGMVSILSSFMPMTALAASISTTAGDSPITIDVSGNVKNSANNPLGTLTTTDTLTLTEASTVITLTGSPTINNLISAGNLTVSGTGTLTASDGTLVLDAINITGTLTVDAGVTVVGNGVNSGIKTSLDMTINGTISGTNTIGGTLGTIPLFAGIVCGGTLNVNSTGVVTGVSNAPVTPGYSSGVFAGTGLNVTGGTVTATNNVPDSGPAASDSPFGLRVNTGNITQIGGVIKGAAIATVAQGINVNAGSISMNGGTMSGSGGWAGVETQAAPGITIDGGASLTGTQTSLTGGGNAIYVMTAGTITMTGTGGKVLGVLNNPNATPGGIPCILMDSGAQVVTVNSTDSVTTSYINTPGLVAITATPTQLTLPSIADNSLYTWNGTVSATSPDKYTALVNGNRQVVGTIANSSNDVFVGPPATTGLVTGPGSHTIKFYAALSGAAPTGAVAIPATGNPILLILISLIMLAGVGLVLSKRRS